MYTTRFLTADYFTSSQNPFHGDLLVTLQALQTDKDRDVRFFSCEQAISDTNTNLSHGYDTVSLHILLLSNKYPSKI